MSMKAMHGARTRRGSRCRSPAMPNGRCRIHGGCRRALRRVTRTP
ncbi:MAG: HGGxSTG domain-containing protein [Xanthobacteraceae bacterium]